MSRLLNTSWACFIGEMLEDLSKTDRVLVLLNRLALAGEGLGSHASTSSPRTSQVRSSFGGLEQERTSVVHNSNISKVSFENSQPAGRQSLLVRQAEVQRASFKGTSEPSAAAVQVVLGDQSHPAADRAMDGHRRLRYLVLSWDYSCYHLCGP